MLYSGPTLRLVTQLAQPLISHTELPPLCSSLYVEHAGCGQVLRGLHLPVGLGVV